MTSEQAPTVCSAITASQYAEQDSTLALSNSQFGKLPNEVILIILEHVERDSNHSQYKQYLLACRHFMGIGCMPLRFNRCLNRSGFLSFAWRFPSQLYVVVRSLTIGLFYPSWTYTLPSDRQTLSIPPNVHWDPSQQFLNILPQLTSLHTFSLKVEAFEDYPASVKFVEGVLSLLPDSVAHLELDTGCSRREPRRMTGFHICEALGKLMPRLHHLSLRTKYVCDALFGIHQPEDEFKVCFPLLERLFIEIPNVHMPQPRLLYKEDLACGYRRKTLAPHIYLPDIRRMQERGAFPALVGCTFYFRKRMPPPNPQGLFPINHGFHMLINVLEEMSLVIPYPTPKPYSGARVLLARSHDYVVLELDDELPRLPIFGFWATLRNGVRSHDFLAQSGRRCWLDRFLPEHPESSHRILYEARAERRWELLSRRSVLFRGALELHTEYGFVPPGCTVRRFRNGVLGVFRKSQVAQERLSRFRVGGGGLHVTDQGRLGEKW